MGSCVQSRVSYGGHTSYHPCPSLLPFPSAAAPFGQHTPAPRLPLHPRRSFPSPPPRLQLRLRTVERGTYRLNSKEPRQQGSIACSSQHSSGISCLICCCHITRPHVQLVLLRPFCSTTSLPPSSILHPPSSTHHPLCASARVFPSSLPSIRPLLPAFPTVAFPFFYPSALLRAVVFFFTLVTLSLFCALSAHLVLCLPRPCPLTVPSISLPSSSHLTIQPYLCPKPLPGLACHVQLLLK